MNDHLHEWGFYENGGTEIICTHQNCWETMSLDEAKARLNAVEKLSAEMAIQNIIIYGEGGFVTDQFLAALKAYADILEGK